MLGEKEAGIGVGIGVEMGEYTCVRYAKQNYCQSLR